MASHHLFSATRLLLASLALASSSACVPITFDCGGPTTRQSSAFATIRDVGDSISVDGYGMVYEEQQRNGTYLHQLVVGIQATNSGHGDTIPTWIRPHITGARLERSSGGVIYRVTMTGNTSQQYGPPVVALVASNSVPQGTFDGIRSDLLANDVYLVIETDSPALRFPRSRLLVTSSHDWIKSSGCQ